MKKLIVLLMVIFIFPVLSSANDDMYGCIKKCIDAGNSPVTPPVPKPPVTPPDTTVQEFPDSIEFEAESDLGTGSYRGKAVILFNTKWEGKITTVTMDGEKAFHDVSYRGRPVFRFKQPGSKYKLPLELIIETTTGRYKTSLNPSIPQDVPGDVGASQPILWKPVSDNEGKLVVLTPSAMRNPGASVADMKGSIIEVGRFTGFANGNRAHYRFSKPGKSYPTPCLLKVGGKFYLVKAPTNRNESLPLYSM